jgi:hypothetical protein
MSTSIDMRKWLGYMYGKKPNKIEQTQISEEKKDMSMRDMLGKMRKLNENTNIATNIDEKSEQDKINDYFEDNNVTIDFEPLKVYPNGVIFGGIIDGQIQFVYKVTPEEQSSGVEVEYLGDFDAQDPENEEVVKKIESYYDIFYKYWRDQLFKE